MEKQLGIATGNCHKFFTPKDHNKIVSLLKPIIEKHNLKAIELTYAFTEELSIEITEKTCKTLKGKTVSIHAPFVGEYADDKETHELMKKLASIYLRTNAILLLIHPTLFSDVSFIKKLEEQYNINIATELLGPRDMKLNDFLNLLENSNINFVLDVGHAEEFPYDDMEKLVNKYKDRICELHLHKVIDGHTHCTFSKGGISKALELTKDFNVPMIIEEEFEEDDIEGIKTEIEFLKEVLQQ
jgi:sugar phosphate isomerase/epimerase